LKGIDVDNDVWIELGYSSSIALLLTRYTLCLLL